MTAFPKRPGFTLVEILIALAILTAVVVSLMAAHAGTQRVLAEGGLRAELNAMARAALERLCEDLESLYLPPAHLRPWETEAGESLFLGEERLVDGRRADGLRFLSRAQLGLEQEPPGVSRIRYEVQPGESGWRLLRSQSPELGPESEEGWVLCDRVESLTFAYHDPWGNPSGRWDLRDPAFGNRPPALVSIQLELADPNRPENPYRYETRVALPVTVHDAATAR